jgi:hypothetical protein
MRLLRSLHLLAKTNIQRHPKCSGHSFSYASRDNKKAIKQVALFSIFVLYDAKLFEFYRQEKENIWPV